MKKPTGPAGQSCEHCRYWQEGTERDYPERWGWCFLEPPVVIGISAEDDDVIVAAPWTALPRFCRHFAPRTND